MLIVPLLPCSCIDNLSFCHVGFVVQSNHVKLTCIVNNFFYGFARCEAANSIASVRTTPRNAQCSIVSHTPTHHFALIKAGLSTSENNGVGPCGSMPLPQVSIS
jgi:hypothetical protein